MSDPRASRLRAAVPDVGALGLRLEDARLYVGGPLVRRDMIERQVSPSLAAMTEYAFTQTLVRDLGLLP